MHGHLHPGKDRVEGKIDGLYFLRDEDTAGELHSEEVIERFAAALIEGCSTLSDMGSSECFVEWVEEWEVMRVKGKGVFVPITAAGWVSAETLSAPLAKALRAGSSKFRGHRWAPVHSLLLYEDYLGGSDWDDEAAAFQQVDAEVYSCIDEIWVLSRDALRPLFVRR